MAVIKQRTQAFNQPIGVVRASSGGSQIGQAISSFANSITNTTFQIAAEDAQQRGVDTAKAAEEKGLRTFNPETGKPEAFEAPAGFGRIAAQSYQSVIDRRFEASMEDELRIKAQEIAQKYPYNANGYEKVMSEYLGSMSENAQGKYKTFITENGGKFLAATKLNIQARAAAQARAQLKQSIANNMDKAVDSAYSIALAGGFMPAEGEAFSETDTVSAREVGNVSNGVSAGLIANGASSKAQTALNTATARGGVEYIIGKTKSAADRNALDLAIRTRGREMSSVPVELRPQVEQLIKYIEPKNIETVLRHSSVVSGDYDAVERDNILKVQARAEAEARRQAISFDQNLDGNMNMANQIAVSGFDSIEDYAVSGAVSASGMLLGDLQKNLQQRFIDGGISESQYNSDSQDARQGMLRPFLIEAASYGNVEEFRVAAITRNPVDMANLDPKQRDFIYAMHDSNLFEPTEDTGFVREVLAANVNSIRDQRVKQVSQFDIAQEVTALSEEAAIGNITDNQFEAMRQKIEAERGRSLTATQAQGEIDRLSKQRAFGMINLEASGMTSASLNRLSTFIQTQGEDSEGMAPNEIALGQGILAKTTPDNTNDITGRIDSIRVKVAREEEKRNAFASKQQEIARILSGGGNTNMPSDRKLAQEMIEQAGINLTDPSSETPEVFSLLQTVQPQSLIDSLTQLSSGLPVRGADVLMRHFVRLASDPMVNGVSINRFGDALPSGTVEFLNDVNEIGTTIGGNANDIALKLRERRDDPKSDIVMKGVLNGLSPREYALKYTDGWFKSPDPIVAEEFSAAVEYLARTGKSVEQINARLEQVIEQRYAPAKYVADPRMPLGTLGRSRFSLESTFPNNEDRDAFIAAVEEQLPPAYSLLAGSNAASRGGYQALGANASSFKAKQVMLVPEGGSAIASYLPYFVNDENELEPLIFEKNGQPYIRKFGPDDVKDFVKERIAREKEQQKQDTIGAEYGVNRLRDIRQRQSGFGLMPPLMP